MYRNPGIYLFQETHNPGKYETDRLGDLRGQTRKLYINEGDNHTSGVAISFPLNNTCLTHISESVSVSDQNPRILYGTMHWTGLKILLINIYAPSGETPQSRVAFFESISLLLDRLQERHIIMAGDFNCTLNNKLDRPRQKQSPDCTTQDQTALEQLLSKHNLIDTWRQQHPTSRECTYGGSGYKKSRIDHIYISDNIRNLIHDTEIIKSSISDHNPVKLSLKSPNNILIARSSWKLNTKVLTHKKYQEIINEIITKFKNERVNYPDIDIITWYERFKATIIRKSRRYTIGHSHNVNDNIKNISDLIKKEENEPNEDQEISKQKLRHLYWQLDEQLNNQYRISSLNARTTSADTTERMSKEFFQSVKPRQKGELISSIKTSTGQIARTQTEISEAIRAFYENLYCFKDIEQSQVDNLLSTISKSVSVNDANKMNAPISPSEVTAAIRDIANEKAPGPDGLKAEFYKTFAHELSGILAEVYMKCIETGVMPNSITNATIKLLFKKGDRNEIGNWRPISLLNVDYKILAKIITERMNLCLPKILHPDQKGFVPTRRLEDAVIKTRCLIEYCHSHQEPKYMILLDQEKAFDRVSREYMHQIIEKFNFPPLIKQTIKAMYAETTANVSVNGYNSKKVHLKSGVRQGCPLSPTIFALCIEPLGNLIRGNPNYSGIKVPNIGQYKISKFADDTIFFVNDQTDHDIVRESVRIYEKATAAKANESKTEILPIGPNTHQNVNPLKSDLKILNHATDVRFLGVNIGNKVNIETIWDDKIKKLKTNLNLWHLKNLSHEGRVFVLRTQALGSIWFQAKFHELPKARIREIEAIVKDFVCKGKKRAPIQYNIMKLPKDLGGMNVPDIQLQFLVLRTSWIKALSDNRNKADWKPLVHNLIENITKIKGIGKDIIAYPRRYPKTSTKNFWTTNLKAFQKLKGYTTDNQDQIIYTPARLMGETIAKFSYISSLMQQGISKISEIATAHDDGSIQIHTPQTIKTNHKLARAVTRNQLNKFRAIVPIYTIPPNHILTSDEKSAKILEITPNLEHEYTVTTFRPTQQSKNLYDDIFDQSDSPIRPYKRNKIEEMKEINVQCISATERCTAPDPLPTGPLNNPLSSLYLALNDISIPLMNAKLTYIYDQAIRGKWSRPHPHYTEYDTILQPQPDWNRLPNRKPHRCIPTKTKDFRYLTMHNGLKIGKQLKHIPDIEQIKLSCHNCDEPENSIIHLLLTCPITKNAWNYIHVKWSQVLGSYEDFIDEPDIPIEDYHKLFGIETISTPNYKNITAWNHFVLLHTLDIMLGNMQNLIIRQFKQFLYDTKKPQHQELIHMFDQNMAEAINKIYTRMSRPKYHHQWIFSRPKKPLNFATKASWFEALQESLEVTLQPPDQKTTTDPAMLIVSLTSDMDHDEVDRLYENMHPNTPTRQ